MLELIRSLFRGLYAIILWICLIACIIAGGIIGASMGGYYSDGHPIFGGFIGLLIGFILNILGGGLVATFLNIDENLQKIAQNIDKNLSKTPILQSREDNSGNRLIIGNKYMKKCKRCKKDVEEDYTACPHCGNNTFE